MATQTNLTPIMSTWMTSSCPSKEPLPSLNQECHRPPNPRAPQKIKLRPPNLRHPHHRLNSTRHLSKTSLTTGPLRPPLVVMETPVHQPPPLIIGPLQPPLVVMKTPFHQPPSLMTGPLRPPLVVMKTPVHQAPPLMTGPLRPQRLALSHQAPPLYPPPPISRTPHLFLPDQPR